MKVNPLSNELKQEVLIDKKKHSDYQEEIVKGIPYLAKNINKSINGDPKRFHCKICAVKSNEAHEPYWDNLTTHINGNSHRILCKDEDGRNEALRLLKERKKKKSSKNKKEQELINTELKFKFASFILENALPFSFIEDLTELFRDIAQNYEKEDYENFTLSKTTMTKISNFCIGASLKENILNDLLSTPFSLMMDECSDPYGDSYLAIMAQYVKGTKFQTKLVTIIELEVEKTGLALYELVTKELFSGEKGAILGQNCMGICSDRGSNMLAKRKGLSNRLQKAFPHVYLVHDYSHGYNLIGKNAAKVFPSIIIDMIKDISNHFSYSCQNLAKLEEVQIQNGVLKYKVKTIPRYTKVRWFSSLLTARRILQLWDFLLLYFQQEDCEEIDYFTEDNKIYLEIYILMMGSLNYYNTLFQQENSHYATIGPLLRESYLLYAKLLTENLISNYEKNQEFECYLKADFKEEEIIDLEAFGERLMGEYPTLEKYFEKKPFQEFESSLKVAQRFCVKVVNEMKKRIPFEDDIIKSSDILRVQSFDKKLWNKFALKYENIISKEDQEAFMQETRSFQARCDSREIYFDIPDSSQSDPITLWTCSKIEQQFPLICKLAKALLILPYSSASVERLFSSYRIIKNNKRNCLCRESLEACLFVFQHFKQEKLVISPEMLEKYDSIWKPKQGIIEENKSGCENEKKAQADLDPNDSFEEGEIDQEETEKTQNAFCPDQNNNDDNRMTFE